MSEHNMRNSINHNYDREWKPIYYTRLIKTQQL